MMHFFTRKPLSGPASLATTTLVTPPESDRPLTVVELFQSQGCSSCPPANDNVLKLIGDPDLLVLTYDVTYWDHLGWKDTFGQTAFDARQWKYARSLQKRNVYTPQVIVNGRVEGVGNTAKGLQSLVQQGTLSTEPLVKIKASHDGQGFVISGPAHMTGTVNLIRYQSANFRVPVARGENGGRTLSHNNVVREVVKLGPWRGGVQQFSCPPPSPDHGHLQTAILVQDGDAGSVLGACRL